MKVRMSRQTRTMITVDEEEEEDDLLQRTRNDGHTTQQDRSLGHVVRIDLSKPVWTKRRLTHWKTGSRGQEGDRAPGWWTPPTTSCTGRSTSRWRTPASARWRLRKRSQREAEKFPRGGSQLLHLLFFQVAWSVADSHTQPISVPPRHVSGIKAAAIMGPVLKSLSFIVTSLTQDARQVGVPEGALPGVVPLAHRQVAGAQVEVLLLVAGAHRPVLLRPRPVQIQVGVPD